MAMNLGLVGRQESRTCVRKQLPPDALVTLCFNKRYSKRVLGYASYELR